MDYGCRCSFYSFFCIESSTNGAVVDLKISGNITNSQVSNVTIATGLNETTISLIVTGQSGTTGFSNMTIPKSGVAQGTTPKVYIDNKLAQNQGYTQDNNNYYVWYSTQFSTHQVSIVFPTTSSSASPTATPNVPQGVIYGIVAVVAVVIIVAIIAVMLMLRKRGKEKSLT